jgi:hypothetical protein
MKKELLISPVVWETPGNSLANFQEQLKGLRQQLGLNGTFTATTATICRKHYSSGSETLFNLRDIWIAC